MPAAPHRTLRQVRAWLDEIQQALDAAYSSLPEARPSAAEATAAGARALNSAEGWTHLTHCAAALPHLPSSALVTVAAATLDSGDVPQGVVFVDPTERRLLTPRSVRNLSDEIIQEVLDEETPLNLPASSTGAHTYEARTISRPNVVRGLAPMIPVRKKYAEHDERLNDSLEAYIWSSGGAVKEVGFTNPSIKHSDLLRRQQDKRSTVVIESTGDPVVYFNAKKVPTQADTRESLVKGALAAMNRRSQHLPMAQPVAWSVNTICRDTFMASSSARPFPESRWESVDENTFFQGVESLRGHMAAVGHTLDPSDLLAVQEWQNTPRSDLGIVRRATERAQLDEFAQQVESTRSELQSLTGTSLPKAERQQRADTLLAFVGAASPRAQYAQQRETQRQEPTATPETPQTRDQGQEL